MASYAYQTGFYVIGGTLQRGAPSYVERQADADLYAGLAQGKFCYVLTSRQMGKSSLMVRTALRLRDEGVAVAVLDLTAMGQNLTAEQWYGGLLSRIGEQLDLEDALEDFWIDQERLGPLQRWMRAMREIVLRRYRGRIVIFVDEIDAVRSLPFSTDEFFAGIREFYNRRTEDTELSRLSFCLLGVATPSDLIRDTRTTPFNIGQRIELNDFTESEATPLLKGLRRKEKLGAAILKRILYWTGGHPYLTQRLCQAAAEDESIISPAGVDKLCEELFLSSRARERDDNLLFVRERILHSEAELASLLDLYSQVRRRKRVRDDDSNPLVSILRLSGITQVVDGHLRVRNRIYYRVFDREWVTANMPDAEQRRQRAAYRRGLVRATAAATLILAVVTGLALAFAQQRDRAQRALAEVEQQRNRAEEEARRADRLLQQANLSAEEARRALAEAEKQRKNADDQRKQALVQKKFAEQKQVEVQRSVQQQKIAEQRRAEAEQQRRAAEDQQETMNRRVLYAGKLNLAQQVWEGGNSRNTRRALEILEEQKPKPGQEDLRSFEWYYLWRLYHTSSPSLEQETAITAVAFSPDGRRIITGNRANIARVWDVETKKQLFTIKGHTGWVFAVAVSPDGKVLATGSADGTVKLWDIVTGQELQTLKHKSGVTALAFSPDGKILATGSNDSIVKLWDTATKQEMNTLNGHVKAISWITFSPGGKVLATASGDGTARLWDMNTGKILKTFKQDGWIPALAFSTDGKVLAIGSTDKIVTLWDVGTEQKLMAIKGHANAISSLSISPNGKVLVTGSGDGTAKLWDLGTGKEMKSFNAKGGWVSCVAFSPDGKTVAVGCYDGTTKLWDTAKDPDNQEVTAIHGHEKEILSVALSPDGRIMATASRDGIAKLWDIDKGLFLVAIKEEGDHIQSVSFSPDGKTLATASDNFPAVLWDVATGKRLKIFKADTGWGLSVTFSPDGKVLATGSSAGITMLWDVATGKQLKKLNSHRLGVFSVAFSPDGKVLATGGGDKTAKLWDVATGQEVSTLKEHASRVTSVVFSPDGRKLVTVALAGRPDKTEMNLSEGSESALRLWDVATGREMSNLLQYVSAVKAATFSPDGKRLAVATQDGSLKLWEMITGQELKTLDATGVTAIAFSSDGRRLAIGTNDGDLKLWRAATDKEVLSENKQ
jgi:WD40 repeat protein